MKAGIEVPVVAGIMPVTNKKSIERMVSMCGASLPSKFTKIMQKYENKPEALRDAGIAYAVYRYFTPDYLEDFEDDFDEDDFDDDFFDDEDDEEDGPSFEDEEE